MSDELVQRLRSMVMPYDQNQTCAHAADKIERLRAEVAEVGAELAEELLAEQAKRLQAESALAALRKRVEEAEVVEIQKMPGSAFGVFVLSPQWVGKRVALVLLEE